MRRKKLLGALAAVVVALVVAVSVDAAPFRNMTTAVLGSVGVPSLSIGSAAAGALLKIGSITGATNSLQFRNFGDTAFSSPVGSQYTTTNAFDGSATTVRTGIYGGSATMCADGIVRWYSSNGSSGIDAGSPDTGLSRSAAGVIKPTNASTGVGYYAVAVASSIAAAGTTQGTGSVLASQLNVVSSCTPASAEAVVLRTAVVGVQQSVKNTTASTVKLFPASGAQICRSGYACAAANASVDVLTLVQIDCVAESTTVWHCR